MIESQNISISTVLFCRNRHTFSLNSNATVEQQRQSKLKNKSEQLYVLNLNILNVFDVSAEHGLKIYTKESIGKTSGWMQINWNKVKWYNVIRFCDFPLHCGFTDVHRIKGRNAHSYSIKAMKKILASTNETVTQNLSVVHKIRIKKNNLLSSAESLYELYITALTAWSFLFIGYKPQRHH